MLILASIFDCLEPVLTICAALSTKSVFSAPPEKRDEAAAARMGYSRSKSDILTDLAAIEAALGVKETSKARRYCEEHFISQAALREILSLKVDYTSALKQAGFFVPPAGSRKADAELEKMDNLLKAIVYAGTGRAVRVKLPQTKYEATIGGTSQLDHESREIRFFDTDGRSSGWRESVSCHEVETDRPPASFPIARPRLRSSWQYPLQRDQVQEWLSYVL